VTLFAFAAALLSIDVSCQHGAQQQTRRTQRWDRRTDRRTRRTRYETPLLPAVFRIYMGGGTKPLVHIMKLHLELILCAHEAVWSGMQGVGVANGIA